MRTPRLSQHIHPGKIRREALPFFLPLVDPSIDEPDIVPLQISATAVQASWLANIAKG
jgi:hypothetical protein